MKPRIFSEYAPLKQVLIHTPGKEHQQLIPWEGDHPLMGPYPRVYAELQKDHKDLKDFLSREIGAKNVLELATLLEEIFENADYRKRFQILQDTLRFNSETYIDHLQARGIKLDRYAPKELVRDLIEGYPRKLQLNNGRLPNVIISPKRELMWTRDSSAATPMGVVINSMASSRRRLEPTLIRSVFKYHPHFDADSIFLDMVQVTRELENDETWSGLHDHLLMEGGNILVLDEHSIAIGVGRFESQYSNRTTRSAFELVVKHLFQADTDKQLERVYLVNVPDLNGFIHLDTVFNMVGPKSAIAMPYVFGHPHPSTETSPKVVLQRFVDWLRKNMGVNQTDLSRIPSRAHFEHAGKVEVYDRETYDKHGMVARRNQPTRYFLDQLVEDDLLDLNQVAWIGGSMEDYITPYQHLKVSLFDQHNMAGNVFTAAPFRSIAYDRNTLSGNHLLDMMKRIDPEAHLERMSSNEIRTDNGGPHCLTMPLLRDE